jgi:cytochrome o ubiquinol oxidase subunit 1
MTIWHILFGRLTWDSLVFVRAWRDPTISEIIGGMAGGIAVLGAVFLFGLVTILGKWRYFWTEWLTSLDHKKIGIMYIFFAAIMMSRALIEAVLMRVQQAVAINNPGLVAPDHFAQLFSTHGTIMVFFVGMPLLTGLINFAMPLQIGSRERHQPVADGGRRDHDDGLARAGRVLDRRVERLSALYGACFQRRRRARLLDLGDLAQLARRDDDGHQLRRHSL